MEEQYTEGRAPETEKTIYKNVLGRTQAEAKAKLKEAIEMERDINTVKSKKYAVGEWMNEWFENYCISRKRFLPLSYALFIISSCQNGYSTL